MFIGHKHKNKLFFLEMQTFDFEKKKFELQMLDSLNNRFPLHLHSHLISFF